MTARIRPLEANERSVYMAMPMLVVHCYRGRREENGDDETHEDDVGEFHESA